MLIEGDRVRITKRIWEPASGDSPGGLLAEIGDEVTIKRVDDSKFPYYVAHDWVTDDNTFCVNDTEIEMI
jgi:hypothetical protein